MRARPFTQELDIGSPADFAAVDLDGHLAAIVIDGHAIWGPSLSCADDHGTQPLRRCSVASVTGQRSVARAFGGSRRGLPSGDVLDSDFRLGVIRR